jgi:hypothetical protein
VTERATAEVAAVGGRESVTVIDTPGARQRLNFSGFVRRSGPGACPGAQTLPIMDRFRTIRFPRCFCSLGARDRVSVRVQTRLVVHWKNLFAWCSAAGLLACVKICLASSGF